MTESCELKLGYPDRRRAAAVRGVDQVMGYHRPASSFNIGKKGEHHERKFFKQARIARS